jgi:hypothetical protein
MTPHKVTDMTVIELRTLVEQVVNEKISSFPKTYQPQSNRSAREILDSIELHRWTPPTELPSTLEMLREDRGQ